MCRIISGFKLSVMALIRGGKPSIRPRWTREGFIESSKKRRVYPFCR